MFPQQMTLEDSAIVGGMCAKNSPAYMAWSYQFADAERLTRLLANRPFTEAKLALAMAQLRMYEWADVKAGCTLEVGNLVRMNTLGIFEVLVVSSDDSELSYCVRCLRTGEVKTWLHSPVAHTWERGMLQIIRQQVDRDYYDDMYAEGAAGTQGQLWTDPVVIDAAKRAAKDVQVML